MERKTDNTRNQRQVRRRIREKQWLLENGWRSWEALHTALLNSSMILELNKTYKKNAGRGYGIAKQQTMDSNSESK